eukprot:m.319598 g.319598  ORF g.319598 m.319598 type:complete len:128 (+) comp16446_c3_seq12:1526-1909(+)
MLSPGYLQSIQCLDELLSLLDRSGPRYLADKIFYVTVAAPKQVKKAMSKDSLQRFFKTEKAFPGSELVKAQYISQRANGNWLPAPNAVLDDDFEGNCQELIKHIKAAAGLFAALGQSTLRDHDKEQW